MRVPFQIPDVTDVDEATGFIYLEGDYLVFEYQIMEWGLLKGERATVKAERAVIDGIRMKHGLFKDRLYIATHSTELLKEIPGPHASEIEVRTRKKHRSDVAAFVAMVSSWKRKTGG